VIGGGVGGGETIDHVAPSHCSMTGAAGVSSRGGAYADLLIAPTAVQLVALVHETPVMSNVAFVGVGLGVIDQLVPSHRSISVAAPAVPLVPRTPTAVQSVALRHETAVKVYAVPDAGLGLAIAVQRAPSQRSMRAEPWGSAPTAKQLVAEAQEIPPMKLWPEPGRATIDHFAPFQCSASGWST